jgi:hypothetical protein
MTRNESSSFVPGSTAGSAVPGHRDLPSDTHVARSESERIHEAALSATEAWSAEQRRLAARVGDDIDLISEKAWLGATGWLDAGGADTLAFRGGPEDAQWEWNEALEAAAEEEVVQAGFDVNASGVDQVIWEAAYDAGHEHQGSSRKPLNSASSFSELAVRWKQMFPDTRSLAEHFAESKRAYDSLQAEGRISVPWQKPDPYFELKEELWAEVFSYGFRWASDEWCWGSADVCVAMFECLNADRMCELVRFLRGEDIAGATRLLDLVSNYDKTNGARYFNRLTLRRELSGELRIHIAQVPNPAQQSCLRNRPASMMVTRRRFGGRQRSSRRKVSRTRGSRRVSSRSAGGGSGDPDESEPALGRLPLGRSVRALSLAAVLGVCMIPLIGILPAAAAEGVNHTLTYFWSMIVGAGQIAGAVNFCQWVRRVTRR